MAGARVTRPATGLRHPVAIVGIGSHLPARVVTNDELSRRFDTSDEWIISRTGIRTRHWAAEDEATSDLAIAAAGKALADAGIAADDLGAVVVCTTSPDHPMPGVAPVVAAALGVDTAMAVDLQAACTGWLHALHLVAPMVASLDRPALVIGAETLSRFLDPTDRTTAVLFGDGAGAVVLAPTPGREHLGPFVGGADGSLAPILWMEAGGARVPATEQTARDHRHAIAMQGREVYRHAVERMAAASEQVLRDAGLTIDDLDLVVAHQANVRIIDAVARRLGLPASDEPGSPVFVTVDRHGNTSAASIPLALAEARAQGRLAPGDTVLVTAFGAGLTFGAGLITWTA